MSKKDIFQRFDEKILKAEYSMCVDLANDGISVEEGAPLIVQSHLCHAISSHLSFAASGYDPSDPNCVDAFNKDDFMKIVSDAVDNNLCLIHEKLSNKRN